MKSIFMAFVSLAISSSALAGTISLDAGESITVTPQRETTVQCAAGNSSSSSRQPTIEFSYCECYHANFNGSAKTQANLIVKYSNANYPSTKTIKEFDGYSDKELSQCDQLIRTVSACRQ